VTFVTFAIGTLALMGCPPFSGFFSKDVILALAYEHNTPIFLIGLFTAFLTAFYMMRLVIVAFFGTPRSDAARASREAPFVMTGPLVLLAIPAFLAGFGIFAQRFLALPVEKEASAVVPILAITAMILGIGLAFVMYRNKAEEPINVGALRRKLYFDDFYEWLIRRTQGALSNISAFFDRWIVDAGGVRGASSATWGVGALLRLFQVGNLQAYSFLFGLGIVGLIYFTVFR